MLMRILAQDRDGHIDKNEFRQALRTDPVLNQVLVRFQSDGPWDADALTSAVITQVQRDGICWLGGSSWQGRQVMRVSVSNWSTSTDDIERSADAILAAWRRVRLEPPPAPTR